MEYLINLKRRFVKQIAVKKPDQREKFPNAYRLLEKWEDETIVDIDLKKGEYEYGQDD